MHPPKILKLSIGIISRFVSRGPDQKVKLAKSDSRCAALYLTWFETSKYFTHYKTACQFHKTAFNCQTYLSLSFDNNIQRKFSKKQFGTVNCGLILRRKFLSPSCISIHTTSNNYNNYF